MENYNQEKNNNSINGSGDENNGSNNLAQYAAAAAASATPPMLMTTTTATGYPRHHHPMNKDGGSGGGDYFQSALVAVPVVEVNPIVKSESNSHQQQQQTLRFYNYPLDHHFQLHRQNQQEQHHHHELRNCDLLAVAGAGGGSSNNEQEVQVMKAKIMSHPQYSNLLQAFMDCQKVGAPPEVSARLTAIRHEFETRHHHDRISASSSSSSSSNKDPELDQFMEAYYDLLVKYRDELTKPVQEAIEFMSRVESQLNSLTDGRARIFTSDERSDQGNNVGALSEDEQENSGGETELPEIDPRSEDRELKNHLLRKYSGYLGSLKQELSKKKKKGKLPKDARQKLLSWWELHYKWPYPSESEKVALAEATGLDQKQINNWFINQRKRHWKPSEDMQFMVMDGLIPPQNATAAFYMEGHYLGDGGPYRFGT